MNTFLGNNNTHVMSSDSQYSGNLSITATIGEQHYGHYMGVAFVEGFCVLSVQMSI